MLKPYPDKRVVRTRRKLQSGLLDLIEIESLDTITVSKLTRVAKVDRTTFYNHYSSINQLLEHVIEHVINDLILSYRAPYKERRSFQIHDLSPSMIKVFECVSNHRSFFSKVITSPLRSILLNRLTETIRELALNDYYLRLSDVDNKLYAAYHAHAITGLIVFWIESQYENSPDYMSEQLLKIIQSAPIETYIVKRQKNNRLATY